MATRRSHYRKYINGKLGIWPLVYHEPAKRNSKNRPRGTLVTKCIDSVSQDVIRCVVINKLLPAIYANWPNNQHLGTIYIQQDNAKTHIADGDQAFTSAAAMTGLQIRIKCQPPNSPDMNVLDLGYFNSIQALQYEKAPSNVDELISVVEESYNQLDACKLNDVVLTLQACMIKCIEADGENNYKLPHLSKRKLEKQGKLPLL